MRFLKEKTKSTNAMQNFLIRGKTLPQNEMSSDKEKSPF